jgi:HAD superfamily hydrolase (TIGR01549 family)
MAAGRRHSRWIGRFDVVLLDMGNTFMFGCDRFAEDDGFAATYRSLGGRDLPDDRVNGLILALFRRMLALARDPARYDDYPSTMDCLCALPQAANLADEELRLLERVFAHHEAGSVPDSHVRELERLAGTHVLGLVSNVWAPSPFFSRALTDAGLMDLFSAVVFSSDHGCIKPCSRLFETALAALSADRHRTVHVGDSLKRDVAGAKGAGLSAVWVSHGRGVGGWTGPEPDLVVDSLCDLRDVPAGTAAAARSRPPET